MHEKHNSRKFYLKIFWRLGIILKCHEMEVWDFRFVLYNFPSTLYEVFVAVMKNMPQNILFVNVDVVIAFPSVGYGCEFPSKWSRPREGSGNPEAVCAGLEWGGGPRTPDMLPADSWGDSVSLPRRYVVTLNLSICSLGSVWNLCIAVWCDWYHPWPFRGPDALGK